MHFPLQLKKRQMAAQENAPLEVPVRHGRKTAAARSTGLWLLCHSKMCVACSLSSSSPEVKAHCIKFHLLGAAETQRSKI